MITNDFPDYPINRDEFVDRMVDRWCDLKNAPSEALQETWRQICGVLNQRVDDYTTINSRRWHALSPGTGTGKTEGVAVYCQLLKNLPVAHQPGVLFVTKFDDEATRFADTVNLLAGSKIAYAYYSEKTEYTLDQFRNFPVLVITHQQYLARLREAQEGSQNKWLKLIGFEGGVGTRKLIVIDEAISLIESRTITSDEIEAVRRILTDDVRERSKAHKTILYDGQPIDACQYLDLLHQWLIDQTVKEPEIIQISAAKLITNPSPTFRPFRTLRTIVSDLELDKKLALIDDEIQRSRLRDNYDKLIENIESLFWSNVLMLGKSGDWNVLVTCQLLIPHDSHGCVVLDATANVDAVAFISGRVYQHIRASEPRNYANVSLHVSRGHFVGKQSMRNEGAVVAQKIAGEMKKRLGSQNQALVVCHNQVAHHFEGLDTPCKYAIATWGNIAGKNDWELYDHVFIVGLQYRPKLNSLSIFLTLQGQDEAHWPVEPGSSVDNWYEDVLSILHIGPVAADVVQAINRVRCRRVINGEGDCEPTGVYLLLPNNADGESILNSLVREMPGIRVFDWAFGAALSKVPIGDLEKRFLRWAENMPIGMIKAISVRDELEASEHAWKKLVARKLKKPNSATMHILRSMGISFLKSGKYLYFERK